MQRIGTFLLCALWVLVAQALFWTGWIRDVWLPLGALLVVIAGWIVVDRRGAQLGAQSRFAALTAALMAVVLGTLAAALAVIFTSYFRSPDPDPGLDGDPCCAHPDTWSDVALGGACFAVVGFVALTTLGGSGVLASGAILGRFPAILRGRGRTARRLAAAAALGAMAVPASWFVQSLLIS